MGKVTATGVYTPCLLILNLLQLTDPGTLLLLSLNETPSPPRLCFFFLIQLPSSILSYSIFISLWLCCQLFLLMLLSCTYQDNTFFLVFFPLLCPFHFSLLWVFLFLCSSLKFGLVLSSILFFPLPSFPYLHPLLDFSYHPFVDGSHILPKIFFILSLL